MKMTLKEYINNPMGKGPIYNVGVRESIAKDYTERWNALMVRENGKINHTFYYDKKHNVYYCHIKVPSEIVPKFYYDVVFRFFADENVGDGGRTLDNYNVQFFSNDPAFIFNYAHAFIHNDLFIKDLLPKMSRKAVKRDAKEKNPQNLMGYVKAIYFAYIYMRDHGYFNTATHGQDKKYDKRDLLGNIQDADTVVEKRQKEGEKLQKKKVKDKNQNNTKIMGSAHYDGPSTMGEIKKISKVGSIGTTKKVSSIGKIGKK